MEYRCQEQTNEVVGVYCYLGVKDSEAAEQKGRRVGNIRHPGKQAKTRPPSVDCWGLLLMNYPKGSSSVDACRDETGRVEDFGGQKYVLMFWGGDIRGSKLHVGSVNTN